MGFCVLLRIVVCMECYEMVLFSLYMNDMLIRYTLKT